MPLIKKRLNLTATNDQKGCKFLGLPAELRNRVYELTFEKRPCAVPRRSLSNSKGLMKGPALLLVCKQIHCEAIKIYYNNTSFDFARIYRLEQWMRKVGPVHGRELTEVVLSGGTCCTPAVNESFLAFSKEWAIEKAHVKEGVLFMKLSKSHRFTMSRGASEDTPRMVSLS